MQTRQDNETDVITREEIQTALANKTIKGVLSRVFKVFMLAYGKAKIPVWNNLMEDYVKDPSNNIPDDRAKQTSAKGNIKREYLGPQLSWPKFCSAFKFAQFSKLEVVFVATDRNGVEQFMREEINFEDMGSYEDEENPIASKINTPIDRIRLKDYEDNTGASALNYAQNNGKPTAKSYRSAWLDKPFKVTTDKQTDLIISKNTIKSIDADGTASKQETVELK